MIFEELSLKQINKFFVERENLTFINLQTRSFILQTKFEFLFENN